jgi:hypothetical protein
MLLGNNKRRKEEQKANKAFIQSVNSQNNLINQNEIGAFMRNQLAYGGKTFNKFAYGGQFPQNITEFEEGGTHEQNPNGGIMQGTGANGEPNFVEEGETK